MCLNLYWRSSSSFPSRFPKPAMYPFIEPCSFAKSKIVLAFSTVARIFFSFRTIPESSINARMSRSDSRATFSGEKSRNAFRKWGHFFSIIRQFKPALKIALDIRSRYPWSSFGGAAFLPAWRHRPCSLYLSLRSRGARPRCRGPPGHHRPPPGPKGDRVGFDPEHEPQLADAQSARASELLSVESQDPQLFQVGRVGGRRGPTRGWRSDRANGTRHRFDEFDICVRGVRALEVHAPVFGELLRLEVHVVEDL